jgi:hypothetical protein
MEYFTATSRTKRVSGSENGFVPRYSSLVMDPLFEHARAPRQECLWKGLLKVLSGEGAQGDGGGRGLARAVACSVHGSRREREEGELDNESREVGW